MIFHGFNKNSTKIYPGNEHVPTQGMFEDIIFKKGGIYWGFVRFFGGYRHEQLADFLLFVSGLEVEAKLQEQEECIDQRPYVAPKAHDQPRPILQMMLGSGKRQRII